MFKEVIPYPLAFDHADARMTAADIQEAIKLYNDKLHHKPAQLYLNPKIHQCLNGSLPDDIEIIDQGGVMTWECWLAGEKKAEDVILATESTNKSPKMHQNQNLGVSKIKADKRYLRNVKNKSLKRQNFAQRLKKRGRPRNFGPGLSKSTVWRRAREHKGMEAMI